MSVFGGAKKEENKQDFGAQRERQQKWKNNNNRCQKMKSPQQCPLFKYSTWKKLCVLLKPAYILVIIYT